MATSWQATSASELLSPHSTKPVNSLLQCHIPCDAGMSQPANCARRAIQWIQANAYGAVQQLQNLQNRVRGWHKRMRVLCLKVMGSMGAAGCFPVRSLDGRLDPVCPLLACRPADQAMRAMAGRAAAAAQP